MTNDEIRRRFEEAYKPVYQEDKREWPRLTNGQYESPLLQLQWDGYQACAADIKTLLESPECVEEVARAIYMLQPETYYKHRTDGSPFKDLAALPYDEAHNRDNAQGKAQASISVIVKKLKGE